MVLDNADDMFFTRPISTDPDNETTPLNGYLPQSLRGSMLITTRDERLAKRLAGMHASFAVNPMSPQEAQELLEKWQTNGPGSLNQDPSRHLLEALGYIPLAITQAAAFISENTSLSQNTRRLSVLVTLMYKIYRTKILETAEGIHRAMVLSSKLGRYLLI